VHASWPPRRGQAPPARGGKTSRKPAEGAAQGGGGLEAARLLMPAASQSAGTRGTPWGARPGSAPARAVLELAERLKAAATPQEAEQIKKEIAKLAGPGIFYVSHRRFQPVPDDEAVGDVEELVEDAAEPVPDDEATG